jgi:hypothetical protein
MEYGYDCIRLRVSRCSLLAEEAGDPSSCLLVGIPQQAKSVLVVGLYMTDVECLAVETKGFHPPPVSQ